MKGLDWLENEFLRTYLDYVGNTEPPQIMHLWSAISAAGACMARHAYLNFGFSALHANDYILLVGPPGVRKSTAINIAKRLLKNTAVRLAPDDTGGQRQGLISAMDNQVSGDKDVEALVAEAADAALDIEKLKQLNITVNAADAHTLYVCASEFQSFIGTNSLDLITFLTKMWDGEDYRYKLKASSMVLENPLLNLIGGITPTTLANCVPEEAIGQGFTSRMIFVFAPNKYKFVARPSLKTEYESYLMETYSFISHHMHGEMEESKEAAALFDKIYMANNVQVQDPRFIYYIERRHTHLVKLSMVFAALRKSMIIDPVDVRQAHMLLSITERDMPDALGQHGLSPIAAAKHKMLEFLQMAKEPIPMGVMYALMQRDMKRLDFQSAIADLVNAGKVAQIQTAMGTALVAVMNSRDLVDEEVEELQKLGI